MKLSTIRRTRLVLGAVGVLLLVSLGGPAVSGRDDKPGATPVVKNQDDKPATPAEAKKKDAQPAKAVEATKQDKKAAEAPAAKKQVENPPEVENPFEAQFLPQFRQLYKAELRFMRQVAEPTKQQYEKVTAESEQSMKVALRAYTKRFTGGGSNGSTNPNQTMADAILQAVKKQLTQEQVARYQKELEARTKAIKRMAVDNLVVMVDKTLFLSADQRLKLVDILENNWDESWSQTQYYWNEGRWFPAMPDKKILPILTESQRVIWNGIPKNMINFGIGGIFGNADNLDEEPWPDDPPKKAAVPEVSPPPREKAPNKGGGKP